MVLLVVVIFFGVLIVTVILMKVFGLFDLAKKDEDEFLHKIFEIKYVMSMIGMAVIITMVIYILLTE